LPFIFRLVLSLRPDWADKIEAREKTDSQMGIPGPKSLVRRTLLPCEQHPIIAWRCHYYLLTRVSSSQPSSNLPAAKVETSPDPPPVGLPIVTHHKWDPAPPAEQVEF